MTATGPALLAVAAGLRHDAAAGHVRVTDDLVRWQAALHGCTAGQLQRESDAAVLLDVGDGGGVTA